MHRLLARQLRKLSLDNGQKCPDASQWATFLARVDKSYVEADQERYLLERSLTLSSKEMQALYDEFRLSTEHELNIQKDRLEAVIDSLGDGLCALDDQGRVLSSNPVACRMLDIPEDALVGMNVLDRFYVDRESHRNGHSLAEVFRSGLSVRSEDGVLQFAERGNLPVSFVVNPIIKQGLLIGGVIIFRDISGRKRAEENLFKEKEQAQVTLHSIGEAVITTNSKGAIEYMNLTAERLTGLLSASAEHRPLESVVRLIADDGKALEHRLSEAWRMPGKRIKYDNQVLFLNPLGQSIPVTVSAAPMLDKDRKVTGSVIVIHDNSDEHELRNQLSHQATHDALTGLFNRIWFEQSANDAIRTAREEGRQHAMLYLDLDQFKIVNDTCGHMAGDQLLKQITQLLQTGVRDSDTLARLGGDEFGLLLTNCPLEQAQLIGQNIRDKIRQFRFTWNNRPFEIGVSIGLVAINGESENDLQWLMSSVDMACYNAKDLGGNRVHIFEASDALLEQRRGEMQWASRISQAIEQQTLVLYKQPILSVAGGNDDVRFEVLVRMLDEDNRLILPGSFIPPAERYNLMPEIDRWVISNTLETLSGLEEGWEDYTQYSINLSGNTLNSEHFLEFLLQQFEIYQIPPKCICFEITETAAISNLASTQELMSQLQRLGCHFALDDFGSGLSSFGYLRSLSVDYLKIDGHFVRSIVSDPIDRAMVESINQIGQIMGIKTVAEFVEDAETLSILREIGVDYAQGYLLSPPMPIAREFTGMDALKYRQ